MKTQTYGDIIEEKKEELIKMYNTLKKYKNPNAKSILLTEAKMQLWVAEKVLEEVQQELKEVE